MGVARGELIHLRLFLEGMEVPVISVSVTCSMGSPAQASIEVIPTDLLFELLPRTMVHAYYLDYEATKYGGSKTGVYRLLFMGELFSLSMSKSAYGSRNAVLHCLDFSNLWDTHFIFTQTMGDDEASGLFSNRRLLVGAGDATSLSFDEFITTPAVAIAALAGNRASPDTPGLRGFEGNVAGILAIMEYMGGVQGKYRGVNDWVTVEEGRVRLMDQLVADLGSTSDKLLRFSAFQQWIQGQAGQAGALTSFRQLLSLIMDMIYYEIVPVCCPTYVYGSKNVPKWESAVVASDGVIKDMLPVFKPLAEEFRARLAKKIEDYNAQNQETIGGPGSILGWRERRPESTRDGWHTMGLAADISSSKPCGFNLFDFEKKAGVWTYVRTDGWYARVHHALESAGPPYANLSERVVRQLLRRNPEDFLLYVEFKKFYELWRAAFEETRLNKGVSGLGPFAENPNRQHLSRIKGAAYAGLEERVWTSMGAGSDPVHLYLFSERSMAVQAVSDYLKQQGESFTPDLKGIPTMEVGAPRERLLSQLLRPHIWFAAPPSCNIIFPEELSSFGVGRQMMLETSRLELDVYSEIIGENSQPLQNRFFAPHFAAQGKRGVDDGADENLVTETGEQKIRRPTVFRHEKFSGIVPKFMKVSDTAHWATNSAQTAEEQADLQSYGEDAAHFNLFDNRYRARTGTATARFLPRLVCGLPLVVFDSPKDPKTPDYPGVRPVVYIGLVTSLSHMVSQGGGQSSVTLSHLRTHRDGVNLDDLLTGRVLKVQETGNRESKRMTLEDVVKNKYTQAEFDSLIGMLRMHKENQDRTSIEQLLAGTVPTGFFSNPKPGEIITIFFGAQEASFTEPTLSSELYGVVLPRSPTWRDFEGEPTGSLRRFDLKEWKIENSTMLPFTSRDGRVSATNNYIKLDNPKKGMSANIRIPGSTQVYQDPEGNSLVFRPAAGSDTLISSSVQILRVTPTGKGPEPFEEAIRPAWISDAFKNENIGKFYQQTVGCGSIVSGGVSVAQAVDDLMSEYMKESGEGRESGAFIYQKTRRKIATFENVSSFHENAYGNKTAFKGLPGLSVSLYPFRSYTSDSEGRPMNPELDSRKERYDRVVAYRDELLAHRGLRG